MVDLAVDSALRGQAGVIGHDEEQDGMLRAIEFTRIKGGKPFDVEQRWFGDLLGAIGQPRGQKITVKHGGEE
jgi:pyrophosphate--fructose-6-phosphate 1-phosphotransferase